MSLGTPENSAIQKLSIIIIIIIILFNRCHGWFIAQSATKIISGSNTICQTTLKKCDFLYKATSQQAGRNWDSFCCLTQHHCKLEVRIFLQSNVLLEGQIRWAELPVLAVVTLLIFNMNTEHFFFFFFFWVTLTCCSRCGKTWGGNDHLVAQRTGFSLTGTKTRQQS